MHTCSETCHALYTKSLCIQNIVTWSIRKKRDLLLVLRERHPSTKMINELLCNYIYKKQSPIYYGLCVSSRSSDKNEVDHNTCRQQPQDTLRLQGPSPITNCVPVLGFSGMAMGSRSSETLYSQAVLRVAYEESERFLGIGRILFLSVCDQVSERS